MPPGASAPTAASNSSPWSFVSSATSAGAFRHRASGRRRSAPSPVHGASRRMRSKPPGRRAPRRRAHGRRRRAPRPSSEPRRAPCARARRARGPSRWRRPSRRRRAPRPRARPSCRPGRRRGRASAPRRARARPDVSASAASCEPSSCTRMRPADASADAMGSSATAPIGEKRRARPRDAVESTPRPGSTARFTRGEALSASSSSGELIGAPLVLEAARRARTIHFGWLSSRAVARPRPAPPR